MSKKKAPRTRSGLLRSNIRGLRCSMLAMAVCYELMAGVRESHLVAGGFTDQNFTVKQLCKIKGTRYAASSFRMASGEIDKIMEIDNALRRS